LEPDYPVYHSLMSGLVQIASRDVSSVYDDVIELAGEMRGLGYQADASTARFWGKQVRVRQTIHGAFVMKVWS
jgi:hypothetical protein